MADRLPPNAPPEAWVCALCELPGVGPARLRQLLDVGTPEQVWSLVCAGELRGGPRVSTERRAEWARVARRIDPLERWQRHLDAGYGVVTYGGGGYPAPLLDDPEPPAVLFIDGDPRPLWLPRVAIVGTRKCTQYGAEVAFELGRDLAANGVCVVSGLARGIDGAAHAGALDARVAPPVAVVANGLDLVYPAANRALWRRVADTGAVLSETPLGVRPEAWRFPARNRIIAGLSDVVVVVESHQEGGSMHTVTEATARAIPVLAVPGPVRSAASQGTNALLADGCGPARDVGDIMVLLGLSAAEAVAPDVRPPPSGSARGVLEATCWQAVDLDLLLQRTGASFAELTVDVEQLVADGWMVRRGPWFERVATAQTAGALPGVGARAG